MSERLYYTYILASKKHGTLYVGVTNDLAGRVFAHRSGEASAFTRKYQIKRLVWSEGFADVRDAIETEKKLKRWRRAWKVQLIEEHNPNWDDLFLQLV
ncbi:GIY-YIG nuclease family protein [Ponticaulis sp.]|uniref:GIY-YIG nuclease family protein n=1 Tax=Ponticaulis sp. TaxID=2020902 RepID=UPI002608B7AF|nr:GIY-YIG nuclease family protein [Ponticaulis sp.]MDF1680308.1 GIY-YIG nuclease family protein [Ponticaulis sp.]